MSRIIIKMQVHLTILSKISFPMLITIIIITLLWITKWIKEISLFILNNPWDLSIHNKDILSTTIATTLEWDFLSIINNRSKFPLTSILIHPRKGNPLHFTLRTAIKTPTTMLQLPKSPKVMHHQRCPQNINRTNNRSRILKTEPTPGAPKRPVCL